LEHGVDEMRRPTADPRALLQVEAVKPGKVTVAEAAE
jgi:hypothetical protein